MLQEYCRLYLLILKSSTHNYIGLKSSQVPVLNHYISFYVQTTPIYVFKSHKNILDKSFDLGKLVYRYTLSISQ